MRSRRSVLDRVFGHRLVHRFIIERQALAGIIHRFAPIYQRRFSEMDVRYARWIFGLQATKEIPGDIVELGVGPGRFMVYAASFLQESGLAKTYWGYDTFAGFPSVHEMDLEGMAPERRQYATVGRYDFYSRRRIERRMKALGAADRIRLVEGDITKTVNETAPERISFLYIDCDLYEGYKAGLEALYARVAPGGIILFDEYEHIDAWPGARRAVDEFFADKIEKPEKLEFSGSYFVRRQRGVL